MTIEEFDKETKGMNMFRFGTEVHGVKFVSHVQDRASMHRLIRADIVEMFPSIRFIQGKSSLWPLSKDWGLTRDWKGVG